MSENKSVKQNKASRHLVLLILLWVLCVCVVNPGGDFPLNDDWSFGITVKRMLDGEGFRPLGWASMPQLSNTLWGALFCGVGGYSFNVLRVSTLAAALLGIVGVYLLLRQTNRGAGAICLGVGALIANPIYYALCHTFMTDVLFMTLFVFGANCFLCFLRKRGVAWFIAGLVLTVAAVLSRQVGLAVPVAFAVVFLLRWGVSIRHLLVAFSPFVMCLIALESLELWLKVSGRMPDLYSAKGSDLLHLVTHRRSDFVKGIAGGMVMVALYFGMFLLPALLATSGRLQAETHRSRRGWAAIAFLVVGGSTLAYGALTGSWVMPWANGLVTRAGIGPLTLKDSFLATTLPNELPWIFWATVTLVCVVGASLLAVRFAEIARNGPGMMRSIKQNDTILAGVFLTLTGVLYLGPFLMSGIIDRYLVPAVPFLIGGTFCLSPAQDSFVGWRRIASLLLIAGFVWFSVSGVRDYLAWNRVRWEALRDLMARGVKPDAIDGGFEFNGLFLYRPDYDATPGKSFWWVGDDEYLVSFRPMDGYAIEKEYRYSRWMPPTDGRVLVSKRAR